jgi:hypothetical protein
VDEVNDELDHDESLDDEIDLEQVHGDAEGDENDAHSNEMTTKVSASWSLDDERNQMGTGQERTKKYELSGPTIRRDITIEAMIQSRKFSIIDNTYTRLAQMAFQAPRRSERSSVLEIRAHTADTECESKEVSWISTSSKRLASSTTANWAAVEFEDGLSNDLQKGNVKRKMSIESNIFDCLHG